MKRKIGKSITLIMVAILFTAQLALAQDRIRDAAKDMSLGVSSVPRDVAREANESNILNGIVVGGAKGVLNTAKGIGEGVFKILTFYNEKG